MTPPSDRSAGEKRRGTRNGASKLTEAKVREIRRRHVPGNHGGLPSGNTVALAREFGINKRTLLGIVAGDTWGWLDDEG